MDIELSIVVCTHNRCRLLAKLLDSLVEQTVSSDQYHILVVDNGSTDDTADVVETYQDEFKSVAYVFEPRIGLNYARNTALASTETKWLGFLDDDGWIEKDWCELVFRVIEEAGDNLVALGGPIVPDFEVPPPRWFSPELETFFDDRKKGWLVSGQQTMTFPGGNMVVRRDVLMEVGGFDPSLGMRGQRLGLAGETVVLMAIAEKYPYFWHEPDLVLHHRIPEKKLDFKYQLRRSQVSGTSLSDQLPGRRNPVLRIGVVGKTVLSIGWLVVTTNYFSEKGLQQGVYAFIKKCGKLSRWL